MQIYQPTSGDNAKSNPVFRSVGQGNIREMRAALIYLRPRLINSGRRGQVKPGLPKPGSPIPPPRDRSVRMNFASEIPKRCQSANSVSRVAMICLLGGLLGGLCVIGSRSTGWAQDPAQFVRPASLVSARLQASAILEKDWIKWLPVEVAQLWADENLGSDLTSIQDIRFVSAMPMGSGQVPGGIVVNLSKDFDPGRINPQFLLSDGPELMAEEHWQLARRNHHTIDVEWIQCQNAYGIDRGRLERGD